MQTNEISVPANKVLLADCISIMQNLPANSIDFILTDPPYLVRYQDRDGRSIQNDNNSDWLVPAFNECHRVLKQDSFMVSFYGWTEVDRFFSAWRGAGFRIVGHLVFRKTYTSKSRFLKYQHEQAFLLAKGNPTMPQNPVADVIDMPYSGNRFHPTQKPVAALKPLIEAFTQMQDLVFDPFCGSGSTLVAAKVLHRRYLGVEVDEQYYGAALKRLHPVGIRMPLCHLVSRMHPLHSVRSYDLTHIRALDRFRYTNPVINTLYSFENNVLFRRKEQLRTARGNPSHRAV